MPRTPRKARWSMSDIVDSIYELISDSLKETKREFDHYWLKDRIRKLIARHAPDVDALEKENEQLKKNMWAWARGLIGQKSYSEKELKEMFRPYVENGDTTGLSPREARLLETLIETGAKIAALDALVEAVEEVLKSKVFWSRENSKEWYRIEKELVDNLKAKNDDFLRLSGRNRRT